MTRITDYTALSVAVAADVLPVVDVNDTSMSAAGTTKKITVQALLAALLGWKNVVSDLGADPTGTADSTVALTFSGAGPYYIPAGTYRVSSGTVGVPALNWMINGLKIITDGPQTVKIRAFGATCNYPVVAVAGQNQSIGGMQIGYNTQQVSTSTKAVAWQMGDDTVGNCFDCHYYDMEWFQGAYGSVINPNLTATAGFFSCQFDSCGVKGWSISSVFWDSAAGTGASNCTGSVLNNFYLNNTVSGQQTSSSYGMDIRQFDEIVFNQLNLEHCTINSTDWFNFQSSGIGAPMNVVINALHCEELTLAGSGGNAGYFHLGQYVNLMVNGMSVFFATLNGTVNNPVLRFFGGNSNADIRGFSEGSTNAFGGASLGIHPWANFASQADCAVTIADVAGTTLVTGNQINAGTGCQINVQGQAPTWTDPAGLVLTSEGSQASITSPVSLSTGSITPLAALTVPANDTVAGAIYKVTAFGFFTTDSTSGTVTITASWGATSLCTIILNPAASLTNSFWQVELIVTFVTASTCNASLKYYHNTAGANAWSTNVNLAGTASAATVTVSSNEDLAIQGTNAATAHVTFTCTGSVPERVW